MRRCPSRVGNAAIVSFVVATTVLLVDGFFSSKKPPPIPDSVVVGETTLTDRAAFDALPEDRRGAGEIRAIEERKQNRYDAASGALSLTPARAWAFEVARAEWEDVIG